MRRRPPSGITLENPLDLSVPPRSCGRWHTAGVTSAELLERISIDSAVCHGQPCIRGTRVLVTVLLDALAGGMTPAEILEHYPTVAEEDVRAAAAYGAWLAKQEVHSLSHGS